MLTRTTSLTVSLSLTFSVTTALLLVGCETSKIGEKKLSSPFSAFAKSKRRSVSAPPSGKYPTKAQQSNVKAALAQSLEAKGEIDGAIAAYESLVKTREARPEFYHRLGVLNDKKGRGDQAADWYDAALGAGADRTLVLCDYGYGLYVRGDYELAESVLGEALAAKPDFKRAHNNLAMVHARRGRQQEALKEFSLAGCNAATAQANLAHVLMQENKLHEASVAIERSFDAEPNSDNAAHAMSMLRSLAANPQNNATVRN